MRRLFMLMIPVLVIGTYWACKKSSRPRDDFGGSQTIYGRLFLFDTLVGSGIPTPMPGKRVILSYASDSADIENFLFSANTDSLGYFLFQNLRADSSYRVRFADTVYGLVYYADTVLKKTTDSLLLVAQPLLVGGNSGFEYIFKDNGSPAGPLPDVKVYVFTSSVLWKADTSLGCIDSLMSDMYGRAYLFGIRPGPYYFVIRAGLPLLPTYTVNEMDSFTVGANVVKMVTDTLQ